MRSVVDRWGIAATLERAMWCAESSALWMIPTSTSVSSHRLSKAARLAEPGLTVRSRLSKTGLSRSKALIARTVHRRGLVKAGVHVGIVCGRVRWRWSVRVGWWRTSGCGMGLVCVAVLLHRIWWLPSVRLYRIWRFGGV